MYIRQNKQIKYHTRFNNYIEEIISYYNKNYDHHFYLIRKSININLQKEYSKEKENEILNDANVKCFLNYCLG